jgi:hypothetical protein
MSNTTKKGTKTQEVTNMTLEKIAMMSEEELKAWQASLVQPKTKTTKEVAKNNTGGKKGMTKTTTKTKEDTKTTATVSSRVVIDYSEMAKNAIEFKGGSEVYKALAKLAKDITIFAKDNMVGKQYSWRLQALAAVMEQKNFLDEKRKAFFKRSPFYTAEQQALQETLLFMLQLENTKTGAKIWTWKPHTWHMVDGKKDFTYGSHPTQFVEIELNK